MCSAKFLPPYNLYNLYCFTQECRTLDQDCPAREVKLPIHYHCPCCLIFTQQSIGQVVRHQLTCCKTLTMLQPSQIEVSLGHDPSCLQL